MEHLEIWQKVARPPKEALKQITGGRLSGKTDISPQWRYKVMTELYGPCGTGWGYSIEKLWTEPGPGGEVMAFAQVTLWYGANGASIPGVGGAALVAQEKNGMHGNDEAYKMAVTDALSVAMKCLGVAADIYAGLWDGSKYKDGGSQNGTSLERPKALSAARPPDALVADGRAALVAEGKAALGERGVLTLDGELSPEEKWGRLLSQAELRKLFALVDEAGVSTDEMGAFVKERFHIQSRKEIRYGMLTGITDWLKASGKAA